MTDKPTPKEIDDLVYELRQAGKDDTYSLASAVLAKWGSPAPVGAEPVALLVRKNSWRDGQWEVAPPNSPSYGLAWANQRMYVYTTPQPTQPAPATQPAPVLWVSPEQFANFVDADEAQFGRYVPARKTCAGNFTMPLFAAPAQPVAEPAPADSVQGDAALWHWLAEYLVGPRTDLDDEIVASETVNDLRKLVKAAIKQGEKQ